MFSSITDRLAKRRVRREQQEAERQEALERNRLERLERELGLISNKVLVENISACCVDKREFEMEFDKDGAHVQLKSCLDPQRKKVTEIRVSSRSAGLALIKVFSHRAVCTHCELRTI